MKVVVLIVTVFFALLTCAGCGNGGNGASPAPDTRRPTVSLTADKAWIDEGDTLTLNWSAQHATRIETNFSGAGLTGSASVSPSLTKTYNVTAYGPTGVQEAEVTVVVYSHSEVKGTWYDDAAGKKLVIRDNTIESYQQTAQGTWGTAMPTLAPNGDHYYDFTDPDTVQYGILLNSTSGSSKAPIGQYRVSPDGYLQQCTSTGTTGTQPHWTDWQPTAYTKHPLN